MKKLKNDEFYSFSKAGKILGKSHSFFYSVREKYPETFHGIEVRKIGNSYAITGKEVNQVIEKLNEIKKIKKEGDHVRTSILVWSTKQNTTLLLPHFNINIFQRLKSSEKFLLEIIRIFNTLVYTNSEFV